MNTQYKITFHYMTFGYDILPEHVLFQVDSFDSLSYSLNSNDVTQATLSFSSSEEIPYSMYNRGICMRIWRKPQGTDSYYLEASTEWLVLKVSELVQNTEIGKIKYTITAYHPNIVLRRRVIAFPSGTKFADKLSSWPVPAGSPPVRNDNYIGQLIKEYFEENIIECIDILSPTYVPDALTNPVDDERRITVSILGDWKFGVVTESTSGYQNLLRVLQDLAAQLDEDGNRLYFDFRTYLGQTNFLIRKNFINVDKSDKVFFGFQFNNLSEVSSTSDYENEINVVYAGGSGNQLEQLITKVYPNTLNQSSANLVRNFGFEETVAGNDLPEWIKTAAGNITRDTSSFRSGTASCKLDSDSTTPVSITQNNIYTGQDLNAGQEVVVNMFFRAHILSSISVEITLRNEFNNSTEQLVFNTIPSSNIWQTVELNWKTTIKKISSGVYSRIGMSFTIRQVGSFNVDDINLNIDSLVVSPFFRSEEFVTFGDIDNVNQLGKEGGRYLNANRAKRVLRAKILDHGLFVYGREYQHGDMVTLWLNNKKYKCHIYAVSVQVNQNQENVDIFLDSQTSL